MLLSRFEIERLTDTYNTWHVSLYLPTHSGGAAKEQDPIRLKNALQEAEERLLDTDLQPEEAEDLLAPARNLIDNENFWKRQSQGLALFLAEDFLRYYQMPLDFQERVVVSDHFHIKPLLPGLSNNGRFYVLALDQEEIELYQGSRYSISEINLEQIPEGLAEILKWDDPEQRLNLHTGSKSVVDGGVSAIFHGHGVASEDDPDEYITRYFHRVDEGVSDWLAGEEAPLVLAGVEYLLPLYQEANSYPHILSEGIKKDPQALTPAELHARAWEIVEPLFKDDQEEAYNAYYHLADSEPDRTSQAIEEIVPAAYFERVEVLFVALDAVRWGRFDPENSEVELHEEAQPKDKDLLDLAAAHTLQNGGTVYAVERDDIPGESPLAAVFRF